MNQVPKIKIKRLAKTVVGMRLPEWQRQGIAAENIFTQRGDPPAQGQQPDFPRLNGELKTKNIHSRSANVVGTMNRTAIINTPYELSSIHDKIQRQLRLKVEDGVIISDEIFDFTPPYIQDLIKEAYEKGRKLLDVECPPDYVNCTRYGYFDKKRGTKDSYMFRINVKPMKELENLSKSTFGIHFNYGN
jgi:hypothetical protein